MAGFSKVWNRVQRAMIHGNPRYRMCYQRMMFLSGSSQFLAAFTTGRERQIFDVRVRLQALPFSVIASILHFLGHGEKTVQ
jgi:hypothetical protein